MPNNQIPTEDPDKISIVLSANSLGEFTTCAYRWHLYKQINLAHTGPKPEKLERGDLIHQMLEVYYKGVMEKKKDRGDIVQEAVDHGRYASIKMDLAPENVEFYIKTFQNYCTYYLGDGWVPLAVEEPFIYLLYEDENIRIFVEGKIDLIYTLESDLSLRIICDHKTAAQSRIPGILSNQTLAYLRFGQEIGIDKFMYNQIGLQKTKKPADTLRRYTLQAPKNVINEWTEATVHHALRLSEYIKANYYPRDYRSCMFGCPFTAICESQENMREETIKYLYIQRDPHSLFPGGEETNS